MHRGNLRRRLAASILACFIAIGMQSQAQEYDEQAVKAELVVRFIEFVRWPNEAEKNSFSIGFFGSNDEYYENIRRAIADREIRGKSITLSRAASLSQIPIHDVLVVAADQSSDLRPISLASRGSNSLIVSDKSSDRIHAMINLSLTADRNIAFEVNKANVLLEQLELSSEIMLLGGTEMDVAQLYREMEESLSYLAQERASIEALSATMRDELDRTRQRLRQSEEELAEQRTTIERQTQLIEDQIAAIDARQQELNTVSNSYDQTKALLEQQGAVLSERLAEVDRQQELVSQNEALIENQSEQIDRQQESIRDQGTTIRSQAILLYSAMAGLIVISALAVGIFMISRDRKRLSQQLESRGLMLEQMVYERTVELAKSEQRYRDLSELSPTAVFRTDHRGQCVYVNERWVEFSGLNRRRAEGYGWLDALHPDDRNRVQSEWESAIRREIPFTSEFRFMTPDKRVTWAYAQSTSEHDDQGEVVGYIGTAVNISERKQLEEQLHQTQKMDALGQLTGGVAHDFNNLLAVIEGNLSLLERNLGTKPALDDASLMEYIAPAMHASRRGAELTNRLLSFSRKKPLQVETVDLNKVVNGMAALVETTLGADIELSFELTAPNAFADLDSAGFETALLNLVVNSRDAMPEGGKLTLATSELFVDGGASRATENLPPGSYLVVSVTDAGTGMDEATKEKAIEPFFTTKDTGRGTGLGLSMVYGFAQQSGGHVLINSAPGQGTSVEIYLPRSASAHESTQEQPEIPAPAGEAAILVVEDDEKVRNITVRMLEHLGYCVCSAADGDAALAVLAEGKAFDLLLTDLTLPGEMDGAKVADAVRKSIDGIKVLYMTGYAKDHLANRNRLGERVNLLNKPFSFETLAHKVKEVLDDPG